MINKLKIAVPDIDIDALFNQDKFLTYPDMKVLLADNLSYLGSGAYSTVFKYKNRAIKLGLIKDRCWYHFGEYVMKHKNKHYPEVYRLKPTWDKYYLADMELLKPVKSLANVYTRYPSLKFFKDAYAMSSLSSVDTKYFKDFLKENSKDSLIQALVPFIDVDNCMLDLHEGNFMWRGSTLVINDPVAPML